MFTGIIESLSRVEKIQHTAANSTQTGMVVMSLSSPLSVEFSCGQSVAHNGVCLTIESLEKQSYQVSVIAQTLKKSMLGQVKIGDVLNIERCLRIDGRLDGHFVQGHVDTVASIEQVRQQNDDWYISIRYPTSYGPLIVPQGSIAVNGISLTVASAEPETDLLEVAIIPHTREHTNVSAWEKGTSVNLEFDILGKYIKKLVDKHQLM